MKFSVNKYLAIFLLVVGVVLVSSCSRSEKESKPIVATVNGEKIFLKEFQYFYELDPNFGFTNRGIKELQRELQFLIDRKLAYRQALKENLFQQPQLKTLVKWELKQAMQRELFRRVVKNKVSVSDAELRALFQEENRSLFVRHLLFNSRSQAEEAYQSLLTAKKDFSEMAREVFQDSVLRSNGGALGWIRLGDIYRDLEDVVFQLKIGEISRPTRSPWGYHILRVDSVRENVMLTEAQYLAQKEKLQRKLLRRKQQKLASRYISEKMGKLNIRMKGNVFGKLWRSLSGEGNSKNISRVLNRPVLTNNRLQQLESELRGLLDAPLVTFEGGSISLGAFLDSLREIPLGNRPRIKSRKLFVNDIGIWVRNWFLDREARNQKLANAKRVKQELKEFQESEAYEYYLRNIIDTLTVAEPVEKYFQGKVQNRAEIEKRYPGIRGMKSVQEWKYVRATQRLREWLRTPASNIRINESVLEELNKSIDWKQQNIPMFLVRPPS